MAPISPDARNQLTIQVRGEKHLEALTFRIDRMLVIGRYDRITFQHPDIDLDSYDAEDKGVSRRHARIGRNRDGSLYIEDLDSANGTYINGHRISPHTPHPIQNNDDIRLGRFSLNILYNVEAFR